MNKKIYQRPQVCVIHAETESLLAAISGLNGRTDGNNDPENQPNIGYGGDADGENPDKPEGGFEIW